MPLWAKCRRKDRVRGSRRRPNRAYAPLLWGIGPYMATIERTAPPPPGAAQDPSIQPVFSADDGRRERALRVVGRLVAVAVGIWLLALLAGAVGFGSLPLVPGSGLLDRANQPAKARAEAPRPSRSTGGKLWTSFATRSIATPAARRAQRRAGSSPSGARSRAPGHSVVRPPPASQVAPPAVLPSAPGNPQGRAVRRYGNQVQPAPPPPGVGSSRGQTVVNPGRLKHEVPPPPPPPPPLPKKP
jgi:pyruvate/2-oxoglutarate dehydrogenase complex dihydrolipoamide acyltransferase (E2) component